MQLSRVSGGTLIAGRINEIYNQNNHIKRYIKMNLNHRFWEIDFLRGMAVLMMISYHFIFDLSYFGILSFNIYSGFWWFFARITASIFIFLAGLSLYLSYSRTKLRDDNVSEKKLGIKYLKRGMKIFALGLVITLATWIFIPGDFIIFGVLHFIGIAIILQYPFLKYKYLNLGLGLMCIALGIYLANFTFDFNWLLWLGFRPQNLFTVDYFPILPWLGVVSLGIFAGNILYHNYQRRFKIPDLSSSPPISVFTFLGRNSLIIYFIHQPILIALLYFLGVINLSFFF